MLLSSRTTLGLGAGRASRASREVATLAVPRASFKDGDKFASILNGCWTLAGGHGREVYNNIFDKLGAHADAGFDTFDTADIYGPSEQILGEFIAARREAGKPAVKVFTKYVPNIFQEKVTSASVQAAIQKSLKMLQVSSLDCVQMHWWDYSINGMVDAAKALADCQAEGLIKHLGVTNIDAPHLATLIDAGVPIVASQVQFSLLDRRPLNGMLQLAESHGIQLLTYGSVGGGLLSDKYVAAPKATGLFNRERYANVDLNTSSLKMYWGVVKQFGGQDLWRELLLVLKGVADEHQVSVANVALRWVMQQGGGSSVHPIVGIRSTTHIADNARTFTFTLTPSNLATIGEVLARAQGPTGDVYSFERGG